MDNLDILVDPNQELQANSVGDYLTGDASNDYIADICIASPGHYKAHPTVGVGIQLFVNGNQTKSQIERAIRLQLEADVFKSPSIDLSKYPEIYINKAVLSV